MKNLKIVKQFRLTPKFGYFWDFIQSQFSRELYVQSSWNEAKNAFQGLKKLFWAFKKISKMVQNRQTVKVYSCTELVSIHRKTHNIYTFLLVKRNNKKTFYCCHGFKANHYNLKFVSLSSSSSSPSSSIWEFCPHITMFGVNFTSFTSKIGSGSVVEMLLDVDKYCLELFECKTCFPQGLVKSLLYILDKSFIHTSPADHGDLDRLNRHLVSCLARWSCSCSLFRIFRIQLAVALNTVALSEIISCTPRSSSDECI